MKIKNKKTFVVKAIFSILMILVLFLDYKCVISSITSLVIKIFILALFLIGLTIAENMEK